MVNPPPLAEDTKYLTLPQSLPSREGSISSVPPLKGGKEKSGGNNCILRQKPFPDRNYFNFILYDGFVIPGYYCSCRK